MRLPWIVDNRRVALPAVRRVDLSRPAYWLHAGLQDLFANPLPSLAYGLLFSIGGDLILLASLRTPYLFMTALSGFFLVAPLLSAGLYELSRQRATGLQPTFVDSLDCLKRNPAGLFGFGIVLSAVALLWEQFTALSFALVADLDVGFSQLTGLLTSGEHPAFVATWLIAGATLALTVFAFGAITAPLLLDRDTDCLTAMLTSLRAFSLNLEAMVLWGGIILALTLMGFATLMVGLVFAMPILGHATWHAYRELVK